MKQFNTIKDLETWVTNNVKTDKFYGSVEREIYWFIAVQETRNVHESSPNDFAEMFFDGVAAINNNKKAVNDWINNMYLDDEKYDNSSNEEIEFLLKEHFQ